MKALYNDYFDIDKNFFPQVNGSNIGQVKWEKFYPHSKFIELLKTFVSILSRQEKKSLWI
jgi:hypothetical protein